ncbi:endonuclease [Pseudactinotalea suaedae]|uniref:endonuclease n=1 Tax=Pseudactinotalea suaedae TaxID=1524924 RepID=UPI0012E178CE|nr:endonuclease [Pseudactinotalea suaedae]
MSEPVRAASTLEDHARSEPAGDLAARLARETRTFSEEAGIDLRDTPAPLFRLLVLASLLAAPVQHTTAIRASAALRPLTRTAATLAAAEPDDVARAMTLAGYWRFHHTKATLLVRAGEHVVERCSGDLRRLYRDADSPTGLHRELRRIPGVGTHAAHIVLREAQAVWPDVAPYLDDRVLDGAKQLGLPEQPDELAGLVDPHDLPRLAAACVRTTLRPVGTSRAPAGS